MKSAIEAPEIGRLLAHMRKVVAYFHRSSQAKAALCAKQSQMSKPAHVLIIDVQTRWNSTLAMLERFIEQHSVVYEVVSDKNKGNVSYKFKLNYNLQI